jgi:hypothetical protein
MMEEGRESSVGRGVALSLAIPVGGRGNGKEKVSCKGTAGVMNRDGSRGDREAGTGRLGQVVTTQTVGERGRGKLILISKC